jgi:hypothetical protein
MRSTCASCWRENNGKRTRFRSKHCCCERLHGVVVRREAVKQRGRFRRSAYLWRLLQPPKRQKERAFEGSCQQANHRAHEKSALKAPLLRSRRRARPVSHVFERIHRRRDGRQHAQRAVPAHIVTFYICDMVACCSTRRHQSYGWRRLQGACEATMQAMRKR